MLLVLYDKRGIHKKLVRTLITHVRLYKPILINGNGPTLSIIAKSVRLLNRWNILWRFGLQQSGEDKIQVNRLLIGFDAILN